ncbi:hypothetical protein [Endozoicomonas sp. 2B-B]
MSVDTLRETHHINRISTNQLDDFLTAQTYRPEITSAYDKVQAFNHTSLQSLCREIIRQGPTPTFGHNGDPCLKSKHTADLLCIDVDGDLVDPAFAKAHKKFKVNPGDLVITRKGTGTIGRASIFCGKKPLNTDDLIFKVSISNGDSAFVAAYLRSYWGERLLEKGVYGSTGQISISSTHIRGLPIIQCDKRVEKYIGDKVRQAERLRAWAKEIENDLAETTSSDEIKMALATKSKHISRPNVLDLTPRLDPKYYGNRALEVLRAAHQNSVPLYTLVAEISNGFEERSFTETGVDYITVSEVSSGRLDLSTSPKISIEADIPDKAQINERCVLAVRTGSIGNAVKVDERDKHAVISSHLIKLV